MIAVQQLDPALPPAAVFAQLDRDVQRLVVATKTLYNGNWDDCAEDIRRRRAGKPYLFKLSVSIPDDLEWLGRLKAYEAARGEPFDAQTSDDHPREDLR
ncbi:MAG: hypothetical protein H0V44_16000 [Planctomycetes bacterium]|nr:hypothetical protein [Planctomycetota bacterium]